MQMASSAKRVCRLWRSASEYTATVRMPRSLAAQMTRSAISPRLAMRILLNITDPDIVARHVVAREDLRETFGLSRPNGEQRLAILHRTAIFHQLRRQDASGLRFDLVHQLHRFDD